MALLAIFLVLIFLYSLVSARLEQTWVTAPMVFTGSGMLTLISAPELKNLVTDRGILLHLAEAGLVLLLFTDASRTELRVLQSIRNLPARLLGPGMLLTLVLGALVARLVFPQLSLWEAGILSAILAPTDAGLGQIIVNSPRVPLRIRQALNVEAGLNDGLSVPFLLFFMALGGSSATASEASLTRFVLEQLGYGLLIGGGIGWLGGWLLAAARRRKWIANSFLQLGVVALPMLSSLACEPAGASMFIAAFVAGLAVTVCFPEAGRHSVEFAEEWGQGLNLAVFFLFGLFVAQAWPQFHGTLLIYAVLSLTLIRMLPVAVALRGTGLSRATVGFMGWFGPRGLASIVLAMVFLQHPGEHPGETTIRLTVMVTVLLSIFAHGLTAQPGLRWYADSVTRLDELAPEKEPLPGS